MNKNEVLFWVVFIAPWMLGLASPFMEIELSMVMGFPFVCAAILFYIGVVKNFSMPFST